MNSPSPKSLEEMNDDDDLNRWIAGLNGTTKRPPLSEVKGALALDRYREKIMEGGSPVSNHHRFTLSERFLFLKVDKDDNVVRGFFAPKPK